MISTVTGSPLARATTARTLCGMTSLCVGRTARIRTENAGN
ncbi:MAG: hypothetical protein Ct9H300mP31_18050 [Acidimicrobiaceae bacterium]|nr:MAG: hypothetical protein Ct9H300mP31_18050 [Acidimicrobiaceae bacterium]